MKLITCPLDDIQLGTHAVLSGALQPDDFFRGLEMLSARRRGGEEVGLGDILASVMQSQRTVMQSATSREVIAAGFSKYRNPREIARGGMGAIYSAEDPELGRVVAIKVGTAAGENALRKFLLEARVTGNLEHPNIVPVHELGGVGTDQPYFAMKLIRGVSLDRIFRERTQSRARMLRDFTRVCDAVAFAHSKGVIHRDLKPQNVMVGEFGEVQVMDWGLAKAEGREDLRSETVPQGGGTVDGTVMGTPAYMPPEQARGDVAAIDRRSDIYSLGAILYEILAGVPPYQGGNPWDVIRRVATGPLTPPSEHTDVPRELEAVVLKAMAHDPRDRYARVEELKADIEAFLEGRVLAAASYNPFQRAAKWMLRHRAASAAVLAVILLGGALFGYFRWQAAREARQREQALLEEAAAIRRSLDGARAEFAKIESTPFREPNGELREAAIDEWFERQAAVIGLLEELASKKRDVPAINAERRERCRTAWTRAAEAGLFTLARTWVGRARAADLDPAEERAAIDGIDRESRKQLEDSIALTRARIATTEKKALGWKPDAWIDACVYELLRHKSPAIVKLLLEPAHLDHRLEAVRLLSIKVLGRMGDAIAVEALAERLRDLNLELDPVIGDALVEALALLGDPRVHSILAPRLAKEGSESAYRALVQTKLREVPLPSDFQAPKTAAEFLSRGILFAARQELDRALRDFDRADGLAEARRQKALILKAQGKTDEALEELQQALRADPKCVAAYHDRGRIFLERKNYNQAFAEGQNLLMVQANSVGGQLLIAEIRFEAGDFTGAAADFARVIELDPRNSVARIGLGRILMRKGDVEAAMRELDLAIALNPSYGSSAYLYRGVLRMQKRDRTGAIRDFSDCIRINGGHVSAFYNRGVMYEDAGEQARALADYETCHQAQDGFWQAWYARGALLHRMGRKPEAREALEGALKRAPENQRTVIEDLLREMH